MRWIPCLAVAAAIQAPGIVHGQEVSVSGWLDRVDRASSTISIRSLGGNRTISVSPNTVVRLNGAIARLDQLPANSSISITTQKDPNGNLRATEITATTATRTPQPAAATPVGSVVRGTLVGMDIPNNRITLRTISGDHSIQLSTAPIIVNGVRGSTRNLRVGQVIQVERSLPTEASSDYVTQMVRVLPAQTTDSRTAPSTPARSGAVRSRTRGSRSTSRAQRNSRRSRSQQRSRATRRSGVSRQVLPRTVWKGVAFQPEIVYPGATVTLTGPTTTTVTGTTTAPRTMTAPVATAPAGTVVAPDATVTAPDTTVVSPGTVAITPGTVAVPPFTPGTTGAVAPGATGIVGTAPQTTVPDARIQSVPTGPAGVVDRGTALSAPAAAPGANAADPRFLSRPPTGVADPRLVSPATPGTVPPAVADPRSQGVVAPGVVAPGAIIRPPNVPDPRNQGVVTPGAVLPTAPAGVGTPGGGPVVTPGAILPGAAAPPVGVPDPRFQAPAAPGIVRPGVVSPVLPGPARQPLLRPMRIIRPQVPAQAAPTPATPQ